MTDRQDIWHHLKDHEVIPPQEVFARLRQMLESGDAVPGLSVQPPLERLQQYAVTPPAFLGRQIELRLGIRSRFLGRARWYLSAAACLVLVVAGWMVYRSYSGRENNVAVERKVRQSAAPVANVPLPADTLLKKDTPARVLAAAGTPKDTRSAPGAKISVRPVLSIEGQTISVTDNDLLVTFTSFTYPAIPAYLTRNTDKPLKINIDQYTHLYVSKNMLSMMKQTYEVLPNGKPARKAKKMKRRLDNWKEKDQKRFDKGSGANPLDPVDLGDFIFR
ncbi:MAG: hypothetical protein J0H74_35405 [Chitinophagaceae bacterium]|nr:hypothetical protein [Chitinophagaceae bacterium]